MFTFSFQDFYIFYFFFASGDFWAWGLLWLESVFKCFVFIYLSLSPPHKIIDHLSPYKSYGKGVLLFNKF